MATRLGEHLVETGTITAAQLDEALRLQRERLQPLGQILQDEGWLATDRLARTLAQQLQLEFADVARVTPEPAALRTLDGETAATLTVLPLRWDGESVCVAMPDPLDLEVFEELDLHIGAPVRAVVAERDALVAAIAAHYAAEEGRHAALAVARADLQAAAQALRDHGRAPRLIVCAAGASGAGLTTFAGNVGAVAAEGGATVFVDLAPGTPASFAPVEWQARDPRANLVDAPLATETAAATWATDHGFRYAGGATGTRLRHTDAQDRVTFAGNLVRLGRAHDAIVCDLGPPPYGDSLELLLGADAPVILTSARDIVHTYELLRTAARYRARSGIATPDAEPWRAGLIVTLVESDGMGRTVCERLTESLQEHVNAESDPAGQVHLEFLGSLPYDRDGAATADRACAPAVRCAPETLLAEHAGAAAATAIAWADRSAGTVHPLSPLVGIAGTLSAPDRAA